MKKYIYKLLETVFLLRGYSVIPIFQLRRYIKQYRSIQIENLGIIDKESLNSFFQTIEILDIKSQLGQDLFVLAMLNFKKDGFFVEFGAHDGIKGSNTYILEKIGWNGILSEPSRIYKKLKKNRRTLTYNFAVYPDSGVEMEFQDQGSLSTLLPYVNSGGIYRQGRIYRVKTISLEDLLQISGAPFYIDYISIDTEGSEYVILENFDFRKYKFGIITIEHSNDEEKRDNIYKLLTYNNYIRVLENDTNFDDYYININLYQLKSDEFND
jgi:hypothetical protein